MKISVLIFFAILVQANLCFAQSGDQERWIEQNMVRNVFDLADNSKVRKELEIADFQMKELRKLKSEYTDRLNRISEETRSLPKAEAEQARARIWKDVHESTILRLDKILLRHQMQRLNQIAKQGPIKLVAKGDRFKMYVIMARQLGLSDKEIDTFQKNVAKEKNEFQEKLADLTKKTDQAVFEHLPAKAQAKLKEVFGEIF